MTSIKVKEKNSKSILSKSKVRDYTVNPYTGCEHGCTYCYARFMKKYTGHKEEWGEFVDVKINAVELLQKEVKKKKRGSVWVSGVCDPYQPLEEKYKLTRGCLEILMKHNFPVTIQTKSPLITRDIDLLKDFENVEINFTIGTADENIRRIFEPQAPPIQKRLEALEELYKTGIQTCVMIAPILPKVENLAERVSGKLNHVGIDRMNYHYADWIYKKHGLEYALKDKFFFQKKNELTQKFKNKGIPCEVMF